MDASITVRLIDETQRGFSDINRNLTGIGSTAKSLNNTMNGLAAASSAFVNALAVREILTFTNNLQTMDNRLRLVTTSQSELNKTFDNLFDVATRTRAPIRETIDLYTKLAQSQDVIGKSGGDLTKIIEAFNLSLSLSGTSGAQASAAILQFSQAMQSGRLNGDEFRTMLEQAPRFLKALSDATGIARGDLKKFASEGLLDSKIIAQALIDALPQLQSEFSKTSMTVGQATTSLSNSFSRMMRDFMETSGASEIMVKSIKLIENNLESVTIALGAFAAALAIGSLIQVITFAIGGLTVAVKALTTALVFMASTPLGRVVSLLGLAAGALATFSKDANAAEKQTDALSNTQKELTGEVQKGLKPTDEMQALMKQLGVNAQGTKDAYGDFIKSLEQEIELSKLDSREKQIQQAVYKALAAEAKKYGGDLSRISETRRAEIEKEVRALATQVEDEKQKTDERKKLVDEMRRKQEEYDRFIEGSRTKNLEGLDLFLAQSKKAEDDYRAGNFRDEKQYQEYMAALRETYQNSYARKAEEFRTSQLSKEEAYRREVDRLTKEYDAGMIRNQQDFEALREQIRIKYAQKYDDMAKKQREDELNATQKYFKDIQELNDAANAGLIKSQEDYDAIRRKIERDYREETIREYSNLYGVLNEKLLEWSGLSQKEYGVVKDVIKLTFGVDVEDLIKEFFAASIRYVLGFRTAATGDMNGIGGVIQGLFGSGGTGLQQVGIFKDQGTGILGGFGTSVGGIFNNIGSLISSIFSGGLNAVAKFVSSALDLLGSFGSSAGGLLSKIFDGIGSIFSGGGNIFSDIIGGIGDIFGGGGSIIGDIFGGIGDIFGGGDILSGIGDIFGGGDLLGSISGTIGDLGLVTAGLGGLVALGDAIGLDKFNDIGDLTNPSYSSSPAGMAAIAKQSRASLAAAETALRTPKSAQEIAGINYTQAQQNVKNNPYGAFTVDYAVLGLPLPKGRSPVDKARLMTEFAPYAKAGIQFPADQWKGIYYYRKGGIIGQPTMFNMATGFGVAGEAGAEAILPLTRGSNGELGVNAMAGDVNITFNITAVDAQGVDELLLERKQFITNMVRSAVADKGKIGRYI